MLELPVKGFSRSVTKNNVNRSVMGDWLEASVLFCDDDISTSDVADILVEQGVVDANESSTGDGQQDLASGIAEEGWIEIRNRHLVSGDPTTYRIDGKRLRKTADWQTEPVRSFLMLLSLAPLYPKWAEACREIGDQGALFEKVSARACAKIFSGWEVYEAGWSANGPKNVATVVQDLISDLGVRGNANLGEWAPQSAKDGGLDILCYRKFDDDEECVPFFSIQCASGADWVHKTAQPSTNKWKTYLDSAFQPTRALMIPFVVDREKRRQKCLEIEGPLFDRTRLLSVGQEVDNWMGDIAQELTDWCTPRAELLQAI